MAEAYVPQGLSLAKLVLYHVLFFDKSCEKRGTVYLYSLQYYDFILQNLTRKTAEIAFAGIYISKFSGGACPRTPLECLAPSALVTRPPQNNHPGYATVLDTIDEMPPVIVNRFSLLPSSRPLK